MGTRRGLKNQNEGTTQAQVNDQHKSRFGILNVEMTRLRVIVTISWFVLCWLTKVCDFIWPESTKLRLPASRLGVHVLRSNPFQYVPGDAFSPMSACGMIWLDLERWTTWFIGSPDVRILIVRSSVAVTLRLLCDHQWETQPFQREDTEEVRFHFELPWSARSAQRQTCSRTRMRPLATHCWVITVSRPGVRRARRRVMLSVMLSLVRFCKPRWWRSSSQIQCGSTHEVTPVELTGDHLKFPQTTSELPSPVHWSVTRIVTAGSRSEIISSAPVQDAQYEAAVILVAERRPNPSHAHGYRSNVSCCKLFVCIVWQNSQERLHHVHHALLMTLRVPLRETGTQSLEDVEAHGTDALDHNLSRALHAAHNKIEWNGAHRATHDVNEMENLHNTDFEGVYIDDLRGETLNNDTVIEAQSTEFSTLQGRNVYKYVRRTEARSRDKIIDVRWIDFHVGFREVKIGNNIILADTASQEKTDVIFRRPIRDACGEDFLAGHGHRRNLHRASRRRLSGVHRKAVQDIAQNKVSFLSVAECCDGELEDTWTRCMSDGFVLVR